MHNYRPPMFGGAFVAALVASVIVTIYVIVAPFVLQSIELSAFAAR